MSKDPRLISCKTECGNDSCYGKKYGLFAEKTCPNRKEPGATTNADKLRQMTDEELANTLPWVVQDEICKPICDVDNWEPESCCKCWLDWLRREAET